MSRKIDCTLEYRGIVTKFLGPTNHRGSRVSATWIDARAGEKRITLTWDSDLNPEANHKEAAKAFYTYLNPTGPDIQLIGAWTHTGAVFAIRYV